MSLNIAQYVSDFLRDAQYRVAQLTQEIDSKRDEGENDPVFMSLKDSRQSLINFMEIVYDPFTYFEDNGYNFLSAEVAWSDREIVAEIEYLRSTTGMTRIPYGAFSGYYPSILNNILGDGGPSSTPTGLPDGDYLEMLRYNASGQLESVPFPVYIGMVTLDINDYFSGRV